MHAHPRSRHSAATLLVALGFAAGPPSRPLLAQGADQPLWTRDSIRSSILGEQRFLRISLPAFYNAPWKAPERFPVLILLDAQAALPLSAIATTARILADGESAIAPAIPSLIIVGVETPNPARFRDMTPPPVRPFVPLDGFPAPGGAPAFLRFLSEELLPFIAARYRADRTTILAGHSLSGAFTAWAFGQAPDVIAGAIALSPTPGWLMEDTLAGRQVIDGIAARSRPGRLFLSSGSAEQYLGAGARAFAASLRAARVAGLALAYEEIADADHGLVKTLGMIPGLRFIFRPVSLSGFQVEFAEGDDFPAKYSAAFDSTRRVYLHGARQLGLPEHLPGSFLSLQAQQRLGGTRMAPIKLRLCEELITWYPTLWNGYDCAGDALARMGRPTEAGASYRRGSEAARSVGDTATAERLKRKAEPGPGAPDPTSTGRAREELPVPRFSDRPPQGAGALDDPTR